MPTRVPRAATETALPSTFATIATLSPHIASSNDAAAVHVLSPPMMLAVQVLTDAARAETARLSAQDALDVIELLRDRLLQLQRQYTKAARADG